MPRRIRPPSPADAPAVLDLILARDVADVGAPDFTELSVHGRNRGALALYESAGMRSVWEAERWEKPLGR